LLLFVLSRVVVVYSLSIILIYTHSFDYLIDDS